MIAAVVRRRASLDQPSGVKVREGLRIHRDRQVQEIAEERHAEGGQGQSEDEKIAQARLGRRKPRDEDRERARNHEPEQGHLDAPEVEAANRHPEAKDGDRDDEGAAKREPLERVAVPEQADRNERDSAQADPDC
jgi:hypothetical protein